jgi:hypothetical protein
LSFHSSWMFLALAGEIAVSSLCHPSRCASKLSVVHSGDPLDWARAVAMIHGDAQPRKIESRLSAPGETRHRSRLRISMIGPLMSARCFENLSLI